MMEKGPLRRSDFVTSIILILFGIWILYTTVTTFPMKDSWGGVQNVWYVSPALFPIFISIGIIVLGAILLFNAVKEGGAATFFQKLSSVKPGISENMLRFFSIALVFVALVYLNIPRIDFFLSIMLCLTVFITMYYLDYGTLLKRLTIFYTVGSVLFGLLFAVGVDRWLNNSITDLFIEKLAFTFQDGAFASGNAQEVKNSEAYFYLNFSDPTLIYADNRFKEADSNNGAIDAQKPITIIVSGDTLTGENDEDFVASGKVSTNLDKAASGLNAVITRVNDTELQVILTGQAHRHMNADDVGDLLFSFQNEAFTSGNANKFANSQKSLQIDFKDPVLTYSDKVFQEVAESNGAIKNTLQITLSGDEFTGSDGEDFVATGKVQTNVSRLAPGLTMTIKRINSTELRVALAGNAEKHVDANDIESLMVKFSDKAFISKKASRVESSYKNDVRIDFTDSTLSYSTDTVREVPEDNGTIDNRMPLTLTLIGDTFTGSDGEDFVTTGKVSTNLQKVAPGLTAIVKRISATEAQVAFTGTATKHADANDVKDLTFTFQDAAFALGHAGSVQQALKSGLQIDFIEVALSYAQAGFTEAKTNDGSIEKPVTITLTGDTLTGVDGEDFVVTGKVETNIDAVAPGLTAVVARTGPKEVQISLTGNALQHANPDDVNDLTVTFLDAAFTSGDASNLGNAIKNDLRIDFIDPSLAFLKRTFKEDDLNDGSIDNRKPLEIRLSGNVFEGAEGENFVASGKLVTNLAEVAPGLRAVATRIGPTDLSVILEGAAEVHNSADEVNNLTFTFQDTAFASGQVASVENSVVSDLRIMFSDPVLSYSNKGFQEAGNDGSIDQNEPLIVTLTGDTFAGADAEDFVKTGKVITNISEVAPGLSAVFTRKSPTEIHVTLTGRARRHADSDDVKKLAFTFRDTAFTSGNAGIVVNAKKESFQIDFTDLALTYSKKGFKEAVANDGTLDPAKPLKITLSGDLLTGADGEDFMTTNKVKTNLADVAPSLAAIVTRLNPNELEVTFTGAATRHANANDVFMNGAFRYSMDILLFVFFLLYVQYCWKRVQRASDEELKAKYVMSLVVSIAVPLFVVPLFKYALLVPFPVEGGGIEIMNILWYSPVIRGIRRTLGDYVFLLGVFMIFVAIITGIYFKFMRKAR